MSLNNVKRKLPKPGAGASVRVAMTVAGSALPEVSVAMIVA